MLNFETDNDENLEHYSSTLMFPMRTCFFDRTQCIWKLVLHCHNIYDFRL